MALEVKRYCNITTSMVHHITYSTGMIHQFLISSFYVFAQTDIYSCRHMGGRKAELASLACWQQQALQNKGIKLTIFQRLTKCRHKPQKK